MMCKVIYTQSLKRKDEINSDNTTVELLQYKSVLRQAQDKLATEA